MTEIKITITAPELENALNNLATALSSKHTETPAVVATPPADLAAAQGIPATAPEATPVIPAPEAAQTAPVIPTAPASTPAATFAQIPGVPLNATPAPTPATAPVPTSAPTYTLDQLATAGTSLIDAGKLNQVLGLLKKYGVDTLTSLPPQNYGAMATDLRALGARI